MGMGVSTIVLMENLPAVVLAIILGGITGLALHLEKKINAGAARLGRLFPGGGTQRGDVGALLTVVVLFCAQRHRYLWLHPRRGLRRPQCPAGQGHPRPFHRRHFRLHAGAHRGPHRPPAVLHFPAALPAGGLDHAVHHPGHAQRFQGLRRPDHAATGLRMCGIRPFPIADMLPAMVLVMPFSTLWLRFIVPLL